MGDVRIPVDALDIVSYDKNAPSSSATSSSF